MLNFMRHMVIGLLYALHLFLDTRESCLFMGMLVIKLPYIGIDTSYCFRGLLATNSFQNPFLTPKWLNPRAVRYHTLSETWIRFYISVYWFMPPHCLYADHSYSVFDWMHRKKMDYGRDITVGRRPVLLGRSVCCCSNWFI